jgi:uncharacterized cupin superfamily protein
MKQASVNGEASVETLRVTHAGTGCCGAGMWYQSASVITVEPEFDKNEERTILRG